MGGANKQTLCGLAAERDFRSVDAENTWIAAWSRHCRSNQVSRQETEFHKAARIVLRQFQPFQNGLLAGPELHQAAKPAGVLIETHLHDLLLVSTFGLVRVKERIRALANE
jgi:hypothetical protein